MHLMNTNIAAGCGACLMNRRQFLSGCAACATGLSGLAASGLSRARAAETAGRPRVQLVFTHIPSDRPIWPNIGYDFEKRKAQVIQQLSATCPEIELLKPVTVQNAEQGKQVAARKDGVDGYIVYLLGLWTGGGPQAITAAGRPTILVDDLYAGSGEFLISNAAARRAGQKVVGISSSRFDDVSGAVRCFKLLRQPGKTAEDFVDAANGVWRRSIKKAESLDCREDKVQVVDPAECLKRLKESRLLVVGARHDALAKAIDEVFGVKVVPIEFKELDEAYEKADRQQAEAWADKWIKTAEKVVEPTRDEIVRSAAMYLAEKALMARHNAQGITINCLGGFYGGHIRAYPCLGFAQLNDDGLVGACEADLTSTISMLTMTYLTGRPGYISDPVIDTSKNQIIYAHCVAPTMVFGPTGTKNPYHIRDHSEDRKGAVVRSLMPLGYMTTTLEFHPVRREVIVHQGRSVENVDEDKACRSKLAVELKGDIDKLMNEWDQWGWHRVTLYGDLVEPVREMAKALKMRVVVEA